MTISAPLARTLRYDLFSGYTNFYSSFDHNALPCFSDNTVFNKLLKIDISRNNEFFFPVIGFPYIRNLLSSNSIKEQYYALYVTKHINKKTGDGIFNSINTHSVQFGLYGVHTGNQDIYYGGNGLIFNEDWNPLMICGFAVKIINNSIIKIIRPICYVSPEVFDRKDPISKVIISKVIPYLSKNGIYEPHGFIHRDNFTWHYEACNNVHIIIRNLNELLVTPYVPDATEDLHSSMWEFLNEHKQELSTV